MYKSKILIFQLMYPIIVHLSQYNYILSVPADCKLKYTYLV